ncbi:hypothetical protein I540_6014 [Mycobacteroides abscessus subsp. bolletii 1513]|uniref:Uncharacterized protein n=1 Tax=Mycobacteroides abscessus subsp. bolletii 1513 TaxID=1299321 RepID=X8DG60_9MYCO|nr:hypothetical protein I540_6014 [Mycobacteroides abscessus subsp. bolletii 1513]
MPGVGDQRQRLGDDADDDLDGHESADQDQGDSQPFPIGVGAHSVTMGVPGAVLVCVRCHVRSFYDSCKHMHASICHDKRSALDLSEV